MKLHLLFPLLFFLFSAVVCAQSDTLRHAARELQKGNTEKALRLLDESVAPAEPTPVYFTELGNGYYALNKPARAAHCWKKALKLSPDFRPARRNLLEKALRDGIYEEALLHLSRLHNIEPYKRHGMTFHFTNVVKIWLSPTGRDILKACFHAEYHDKTGKTPWGYHVFIWHSNACRFSAHIKRTRYKLAAYLKQLSSEHPDDPMYVFAHSAGVQLLAEALYVAPELSLKGCILTGGPMRSGRNIPDPEDRPRRLHNRKTYSQKLILHLSKSCKRVGYFGSDRDFVNRWCGASRWYGYAGTTDYYFDNITHRDWNLTDRIHHRLVPDGNGGMEPQDRKLLRTYILALGLDLPEPESLNLGLFSRKKSTTVVEQNHENTSD